MSDQEHQEGDGTVSMKIFVGTLGGGTLLIFLAQLIPEKFTGIVSVVGAIIVAGGLLWLTGRRIHMRIHTDESGKRH